MVVLVLVLMLVLMLVLVLAVAAEVVMVVMVVTVGACVRACANRRRVVDVTGVRAVDWVKKRCNKRGSACMSQQRGTGPKAPVHVHEKQTHFPKGIHIIPHPTSSRPPTHTPPARIVCMPTPGALRIILCR